MRIASAGTAQSGKMGKMVEGKPLPFVPYVDFEEEFAGYSSGRAVKMRRFPPQEDEPA
jgi:hypothetical protein